MSENDIAGANWCAHLYEVKAAGLILYGRSLGLSHSEAEDVLQETFVTLLRRGEIPDNPEAYSVRAYRSRALNYHRSLWRRLAREWESSRWFERAEHETDAERAAMRQLETLPAEQREVIVLKIWHEYTFEEIARLLDLSANTVAGRYRYGMNKLRSFFKDQAYESGEYVGSPLAALDAAPPVGKP